MYKLHKLDPSIAYAGLVEISLNRTNILIIILIEFSISSKGMILYIKI